MQSRRKFVLVFFLIAILLLIACDPVPQVAEVPMTASPTTIATLIPTNSPEIPTLTPLPTATLTQTAIPTPVPTRKIIETRPACEHDGTKLHCYDDVLNLEFQVPSRWGKMMARLSDGSCGGHAYSYSFINNIEAPRTGGLSLDYCEPRGGNITTFRGFTMGGKPGASDVDGCSLFTNAVSCYHVQDDIVLAILFPTVDTVCDPGPDTVSLPTAIVAVNLPEGQTVNGFIFVLRFMSTQLEDQLFEPLGGTVFDFGKCNDVVAQQRFDELSQSIAQKVVAGAADEETNYKLGLINEFANSIKSWTP